MTSSGVPDPAATAPPVVASVVALVECPCGLGCDRGECWSVPVLNLSVVPTSRDGWDRPDEVAAWVRGRGPGDALVEPLLAAARSGGLSVRGRVDALAAVEAARAMLDAVQLRLIEQMGREDPDGKDWAREDVAAALRVAPVTAGHRMQIARAALTRFPLAVKALEAGAVTLCHVRRLVDGCVRLEDVEAGWVEQLVLPDAPAQTVGEFGRSVDRFVMMLDEADSAKRHELARKDRAVTARALADAMGELHIYGPLEQVAASRTVIDALAARIHPGDPRTADQRRADIALDLLSGCIHPDTIHTALTHAALTHAEQSATTEPATSADPADIPVEGDVAQDAAGGDVVRGVPRGEVIDMPRRRGVRPSVLVTVPLATLAGQSDHPGELAGFGPIPAYLARRIAADPTGTWRRLLTDPRGRLLDYGRTTYRPPADLDRYVTARDQTCCFPGCARAATRCEIDHCRDWTLGGQTNPDNLYALCARHHHLKHETGWRYQPLPDGDLHWTSPTGHTYTRRQRTYPDHTYLDQPPQRRPPPPPPANPREHPPPPGDPPPF